MNEPGVLIVGAGPAGVVAARWLAQAGHRVILVDKPEIPSGERPAEKIGESLPGAARPLLRDLGLLPYLESSGPIPCPGNLAAWFTEELIATDFLSDPSGEGWHLDRPRFDAALRQAAIDAGAVWEQQRFESIERREDGLFVTRLAEGEKQTRFVIDASGRNAIVARRLGITRQRDEARIAVYAFCDESGLMACEDQRSVIERQPEGWWYAAPLPGKRRVASFHTSPEAASRLLAEEGAWQKKLATTRHIHRFCAEEAKWSPPRATDASGSRLARFQGEGWLAIGDAACTFDPLSSQGLFNALYTGLRGAEAVVAELRGDGSTARRYSQTLEEVWRIYRGRLAGFQRSG